MGSSSNPQQSTSTSNTSVSYGLQDSTGIWGNSNQITYNMTDSGMVQGLSDFAKEGMGFMSNLSSDLVRGTGRLIEGVEYTVGQMGSLTNNTVNTMGTLADNVTERMGFLSMDAIRQNSELSRDAILSNSSLANNAILAGNDLAFGLGLENAKLARDSLALGGDLFAGFASELNKARQDSTQAVIDQGRYAMQYADNASRSDGQQLALDTNKRTMYMVLGGAAIIGAALYLKQ